MMKRESPGVVSRTSNNITARLSNQDGEASIRGGKDGVLKTNLSSSSQVTVILMYSHGVVFSMKNNSLQARGFPENPRSTAASNPVMSKTYSMTFR